MTARIPICTYRLQFNKDFNFRDATALVDYLDALGVSDLYASPLLAARPGSTHGYDVVDHGRLNPELGTESDLDALGAALRARGMGLVLDVVPNHMCIASPEQPLVERRARERPQLALRHLLRHRLAPAQVGAGREDPAAGARASSTAACSRGARSRSATRAAPSRPTTATRRSPSGRARSCRCSSRSSADLRRTHPDDHPDVLEIESIVTATKNLPTRWETDPEKIRERQREKEIVKRRLDALVSASAAVRDALERSLAAINGERGKPRSFDALEALLGEQAYRLSYWGVAAEEINYRRFFDINDLAAIRIEEPKVLEAVHEKAFALLRDGKVTGLRIDHVDGLFDPRRYLEDLQRPRDGEPEAAPRPTRGASTSSSRRS